MYWLFEFDDDLRKRLRATILDWSGISINVLESLGMAVSGLIFFTQSNIQPTYAREYYTDAGGWHARPPFNGLPSARGGEKLDVPGRTCVS